MSGLSRFLTRPTLRFTFTISLALVIPLASLRPNRADEPRKYGNALDWAPADVAFLSSYLRNKEQYDLVVNSRAWKKLTNLPSFQQFWQMMQMAMTQPGNPLADLQQALQGSENQQLLELAGDLASHEVVYYGDLHAVEMWELGSRAYNAARSGIYFDLFGAGGRDVDALTTAMTATPLRVCAQNLDKIETPTIVVGFKYSNAERVTAQLKRLEKLLTDNLDAVPQLKGHFEHKKIDSNDFLVLNLDGQMIPWDKMPPVKKLEKTPGEFDKLIEKVKHLPLVVAIGIRGDYLLVSIGPSTDHLAALGSGKRLVDRSEIQPLTKFAGERLTRIEFASQASRRAQAVDFGGNPLFFYAGNFEGVFDAMRGSLARLQIAKETQARIDRSLDDLRNAIIAFSGRLGDTCGVTFLTPHGTESYSYDWSEPSSLDGSKPLDLLDHAGGSPLAAIVSRTKSWTDKYHQVVDLAAALHNVFEAFAVPQMPADAQQQYRDAMEFAKPLLARLDAATTSLLLPGLADGQVGLVVDAKLNSRQGVKAMPRLSAPLPMPEVALVLGVSDEELVKKAIAEYRAVADAIVARIKLTDPQALPADFAIPDPQVRETRNGTIYSFPFAKEFGFDPQFAFSAGLSKRLAVLTVAPKHASELLAATPLEGEGPAADAKRPLAAATYLDWASVVEAATPWIEYSAAQYYAAREAVLGGLGGPPNRPGADSLKSTLAEIHGYLEVAQVLRTISSASYAEGRAMVTHSETHYRDLP